MEKVINFTFFGTDFDRKEMVRENKKTFFGMEESFSDISKEIYSRFSLFTNYYSSFYNENKKKVDEIFECVLSIFEYRERRVNNRIEQHLDRCLKDYIVKSKRSNKFFNSFYIDTLFLFNNCEGRESRGTEENITSAE
jgi:hypothetical protein